MSLRLRGRQSPRTRTTPAVAIDPEEAVHEARVRKDREFITAELFRHPRLQLLDANRHHGLDREGPEKSVDTKAGTPTNYSIHGRSTNPHTLGANAGNVKEWHRATTDPFRLDAFAAAVGRRSVLTTQIEIKAPSQPQVCG